MITTSAFLSRTPAGRVPLHCESWPIYVISFYIICRQNELLNQALVLGWLPISIFIETPSLEGLPTKSKEANSLHKIKLQVESNPVFFGRGGWVRGASTPVFLSRQHLKKGIPAKAKEASSLSELRLPPLDVDPVFPSLSIFIYYYYFCCYYYYCYCCWYYYCGGTHKQILYQWK